MLSVYVTKVGATKPAKQTRKYIKCQISLDTIAVGSFDTPFDF